MFLCTIQQDIVAFVNRSLYIFGLHFAKIWELRWCYFRNAKFRFTQLDDIQCTPAIVFFIFNSDPWILFVFVFEIHLPWDIV